jgi:GNAT superfamily N-acetyltransferase
VQIYETTGQTRNPEPDVADARPSEEQSLEVSNGEQPMPLAGTLREGLGVRPSIAAVSREELRNIVGRFRDSVKQFMADILGEQQSPDLDRWTERYFDVLFTLNQFQTGDQNQRHIYACFAESVPVGLISIEKRPGVAEIKQIVSHPGAAGADEIMLEKAVNKSESFGSNGRLYLQALRTAMPFYESAGFELVEPGKYSMVLDPRSSALWQQTDGSWHLVRRASKANFVDDDHHSLNQHLIHAPVIDTTLSSRPLNVEVRPEQLKDLVEVFRRTVDEFMAVPPGHEPDAERKIWTNRHVDVLDFLTDFENLFDNDKEALVYGCTMNSIPVGLIAVKKRAYDLEITHIVSHPAVAGAGELILEQAVNASESFGFAGSLYLHPLTSAMPFYQSAGFTPDGVGLRLDPGDSDKWLSVSGSWCLARHARKAGLVDRET